MKNKAKLNQIIAVEKGVKGKTHSSVTQLHRITQKPDLFNGLHREYRPKNDEGTQYPPESVRVQYTYDMVLRGMQNSIDELMHITARKDWTNCAARADVVVDNQTILSSVPITYLLFLEKQVTDIRKFIDTLPILDPSETWHLDQNSSLQKSETLMREKTQKVQRPIMLAEATTEHPAQAELITQDEIVGFWHQQKHSGAIPQSKKDGLLERVNKLLDAIKMAREEANTLEEVDSPDVGKNIFGYLMPEKIDVKSDGGKE